MSNRRGARKARATKLADGLAAPAELLDPESPVWHHVREYFAFLSANDYTPTPKDRMGLPAHPFNRRRRAVGEWGVDHGYLGNGGPDWNRLRPLFGLE